MGGRKRTVRERVELGNYLASQNQWPNAIIEFRAAMLEMLSASEGVPLLGPTTGLLDALRDIVRKQQHETENEWNPVAASEAPDAVRKLQAVHQETSHRDLGALPFISVFSAPDSGCFVVIYHDKKSYRDLDFAVPTGESLAFVVVHHHEGFESGLLTPARARQLSYVVAHVGWAWVESTIAQYYQHPILNDEGVPAIKCWALYYHFALCLNPDDDWTLARAAEVYRNIANGWPGSPGTLDMPDERVNNYVRSLVLFKAAIDLNPRAFWAHAHMGAAIVNVRAFVGPLSDPETVSPALRALLEDDEWFTAWHLRDVELVAKWSNDSPLPDPNDQVPLTIGLAFIETAIWVLSTALELTGEYYPWAQMYYADALLVKALILGENASGPLGVQSMLESLTSVFLDPTILVNAFGPGDLVESGFFSPAMVSFYAKDYVLAWRYARRGMFFLFKNDFIPGLPALFGCQLLAKISAAYIADGSPPVGGAEFVHHRASHRWVAVDIPVDPISTERELVEFIDIFVTYLFRDFIAFWLRADIKINTSIHMSLMQSYWILSDIHGMLGGFDVQDGGVIEKVGGYIHDIRKKLGLAENLDFETYEHSDSDMMTTLYSGKPSYHMCTATNKLRRR